jgi:hypothetical protein
MISICYCTGIALDNIMVVPTGIVTAARAMYRAGKAIAVISKAGLALFDGPA